jgi:mRNA-degrading endonuclease toxin of MazEF toxin-antitoxin module
MARGDIVFVQLPPPPGGAGHEQTGLRPGIIMSIDQNPRHNMLTIIPLTSNTKAERFPYTLVIEPSQINGLSVRSVALIFQMTSIDQARIRNLVGQVEPDHQSQIDAILKRMLGL